MARLSVIIVAVLVCTVQGAGADTTTAPERNALRAVYQELVEIDTTHASGSTTRAAEAMAARLRAGSFATDDVVVVGEHPTKRNLVARLRGTGARRPLLLLAHLDVVEARRDDWSLDPFVLTERDGFFYGRGTLDDKAMAAIFVRLLVRMKQAGVTPNRDIILALTADEEGGPDNGVEWLLQHRRDLVDAAFVLNEGGGGRMRAGKYLSNTVQASEKTYMNFAFEVRDKGGHSSQPTQENAIYRLAHGLARLEKYEFPVQLNDITRAFFERSATAEGGQTAADMRAILRTPPDAKAVARLSAIPAYNATLRTTCVATRLEGGHADNALPQLARALVNCRAMPGHSAEAIRAALVRVVADARITVTVVDPGIAGPNSPLDPQLMEAIEEVSAAMWPGLPVVPLMSTGASDARYFRLAGIPAYGVSGIFVDIDDLRAHGRDERLGVKQFYDGYEFLSRLVATLAGL
jgi:acetylornithine deacetylase/succinyl-diaminopimelate desuccinylase-like protein